MNTLLINNIKRLFLSVILTISSQSLASNVPEKILNLPIYLENGEKTSLADYAGKHPVYLKFWATWCQPCREQMPHFQKVQEKYGSKLKVIAINIDLNESEKAIKETREAFGLTMAMAIDEDKSLANNMQLIGTPYHLLFDKQMNLVHVTHDADSVLDNKIDMVVQDNPLQLISQQALSSQHADLELPLNDGKIHALFFTATWCDWYFKESRPVYAKQCKNGQTQLTKLATDNSKIKFHGIISRLWTGNKELTQYQAKYKIPYDNHIDSSNKLFLKYGIEQLPTLVVIKNNEVLARIESFDAATLQHTIERLNK